MILLTFNIVNHDAPFAGNTGMDDDGRTEITLKNTQTILQMLELFNVKATFFVEISLLERMKSLLKKIVSAGHEVALLNLYYTFQEVENAKVSVETFLGKGIRGIRQKSLVLDLPTLKNLEFTYISNIENAGILFPFQRLKRSTEIQEKQGMAIVPESISPYSQLPYNDFVFQILPSSFYQNMVFETLKTEEFVLIYLDSRQFTNYQQYPFKVPFYRKWNAGRKMEDKLHALLEWINEKEYATSRMKDYIF